MQGIQEIEVKTTLYVTDDGKRFNNLESAQEHEKHLEAVKKLETFRIAGPKYTPFDAYKCPAYNWQWYKVHDLNELERILRLAAEVYAMENCSDDDFKYVESRFYNNLNMMYYLMYRDPNNEQRRKLFPKYIAISFDRESMDTLDCIERKHEVEMENWKKFYQYFKNEFNKDIES